MTRGDAAALRAGDPAGILDAFLRLPDQLGAGYRAGREAGVEPVPARSLVLCGVGGSAAGGDVVAAAFADRLALPVIPVRGYAPPAHCGPDDLVVCLSYSGGTEETLSCYGEARARGSRIVAVCAGGALADRAREDGAGLVLVPGDVPMPRAGLGYLAGGAAGALVAAGILPSLDEEIAEAASAASALAEEIAPERPDGEALEIAQAVGSHVPVAWGAEGLAARAAFRWKAAFNENAKVPAFSSDLPELTHHEIAGWSAGRGRGFLVTVLRHEGEHPGVGPRVAAALRAVEESGLGWREIRARGGSPLARILSLILIGDVASTLHALTRGVDPTPIAAIDGLKRELTEGSAG